MRKNLLLIVALFFCVALGSKAAVFETSPIPLQESSQNVKITFHADQSGVAALTGLTTDLYAHIGVYTNLSPSTWKYVIGTWSSNEDKKTLKRVAENTYELTIGDIRTYFGITDPEETVTKICIIARTATGNAQTSDNFLDVLPPGFAMSFTTTPDNLILLENTTVDFSVNTTENASIKIYVNDQLKKEADNVTNLVYSQTFSDPDTWTVKAVATNGTDSFEATKTVSYIGTSTAADYPGGIPIQGAVKNSDGSVTFCFAAPEKNSVTIIGSWDNYIPTPERTMKYQDYEGYRYFWTTVKGLDNSTYYPYYYFVDGKYKVSDPYAHLILDNNVDKSLSDNVFPDRPRYPYDLFDDTMLAVYKGDIDDYKWTVNNFKVENPKSMTIYELLFRDFTGTNSKADGTVREAIEKIPYLKQLGITVVELMPIMQFDGNNSWGYNTNNYMAPDKSYGSPDDYKEFIDKCHQAGIGVVLDIVFNHTPGLHPWYQMYEVGKSPFYNAKCPHDYGVYNDIKQEYPLWEKHWEDVLTYWLTAYKVDGFRFDLVKGLGDSDSYTSGTEAYNRSRITRMAKIHAAMRKVNPNVLHINEHLASQSEETPMGNDGQYLWNNQSGNSGTYAKGNSGGDMKYMYSKNCNRPEFSTIDYMESHDEQRLGYLQTSQGISSLRKDLKLRMQRLGSAAAQMLMFPGPKMIWQFGELGADQSTKSGNNNNTSPKRVVWDYLNDADRAGLHQNYVNLCNLRKDNPEMFGSSDVVPVISGFGSSNNTPRILRLTKGTKEIILLVNAQTLADGAQTITATTSVINANNYQVIAASKDFEPVVNGSGTSISVEVPSHCFVVLASKDVADVEDVISDEITDNVKVYGGNGEIIIDGDYNNVEVYNMSGMRMGSLNVAPGLYIVNVDGNVTKVAVR